MRYWLPLLMMALALCCCGNEGGPDYSYEPVPKSAVIGPMKGGSADAGGGTAVILTLSGTVSFERLPVTATGLDSVPVTQPCRGVLVEVVKHNELLNVLASGYTDSAGAYSIAVSTDVDFFVRARAESGAAPDLDRVFHAETAPRITYAIRSTVLNRSAGSQTVDLHASHELKQYSYRAVIHAGPFAILDTMQRLRAAAAAAFPAVGAVDAYWAAGGNYNYAGPPKLKDGDGNPIYINRTFVGVNGPDGNPSIYVEGGAEYYFAGVSDHDEYDETVIAQAWASLLQKTQSRDNAFAQFYSVDSVTPNDAYSYGLHTALGCALLGAPVLRDTFGYPANGGGGTSGYVQFVFDCESGALPGSGTGYNGGYVVARMLWDLLDGGAGWPADSDVDSYAIDAPDFAQSFAALSTRGDPYRIAWLPSLLQQLIDDGHLSIAEADALAQSQGESFPPAGGADPWPLVMTLGGAAVSGTLDAGAEPAGFLGPQANAVYRLDVPATQAVTFTLTRTTNPHTRSHHNLYLQVYDMQGRLLLWESTKNKVIKTFVLDMAAGSYVVRVVHFPFESPLQSGFTLTAQ